MTEPHVDVPPEDEGVEDIDVAEVPEPERPEAGDLDPTDDYTEGHA